MKKLFTLMIAIVMVLSLPLISQAEEAKKLKIGSTWWDLGIHGTLGDSAEQAKLAGEAVGFDVAFNNGAIQISGEAAITAVEDLIAAGCDGIAVINYSESCLVKIASLCEENKVYFCQMYRTINDPEVAAAVENNPYYVGRVHEDEYATSYKLVELLATKGVTNVALISENHGDNTNETRAQAYRDACAANGINIVAEEWNTSTDAMTDYATNLLMAYPEVDGFLLIRGDFAPYVVAAEENLGMDVLPMVATDFSDSLAPYIEEGKLIVAGGHHCDTTFAMLLLYNAMNGAYNTEDYPIDIVNNMLIIASPEDYANFNAAISGWAEDWENNQAYNPDELRALTITYNPDHTWQDIAKAAGSISVEDVVTRHNK